MKDIHGNMNIDSVEDVVEEVQEQTRLAEEMGAAISKMATTDAIDEEELANELAELQQEALDERMVTVSGPPIREPVGAVPSRMYSPVVFSFPICL